MFHATLKKDTMNDDAGDRPRWRGLPRWAGVMAVAASVALVTSGCGGGGASAGSGASPSAISRLAKQIAYSQCIRSHGVPKFPDPDSNGELNVSRNALGVSYGVLQAAQNACSGLLPGGGQSGQSSAQNVAQALKFAQCIRKHGVPNWPDPGSNGAFNLGGTGINAQSSAVLAAQQACKSVMPGDLSVGDSTSVPS